MLSLFETQKKRGTGTTPETGRFPTLASWTNQRLRCPGYKEEDLHALRAACSATTEPRGMSDSNVAFALGDNTAASHPITENAMGRHHWDAAEAFQPFRRYGCVDKLQLEK